MKIEAKVIRDSINSINGRITTMVITFPRIILAEFNTHRVFSRNSASSRAIPFEKMVKAIEENPFIPIAFQKDHKGMQGTEYFEKEDHNNQRKNWQYRAMKRCEEARLNASSGLTKQLVNRSLEEFMWHTVIVTATEWENFFALRCPRYEDIYVKGKFYRSWKDYLQHIEDTMTLAYANSLDTIGRLKQNKGQAEIHMMALAEAMWDAYNESTPKQLQSGEWHLPYNEEIVELMKKDGTFKSYLQDLYEEEIEGVDDNAWSTRHKVQASSMMAARTSYTVVGEDQKEWTFDKYLQNAEKLESADPIHASPFEHCALCDTSRDRSRNFSGGWIQYREIVEDGKRGRN